MSNIISKLIGLRFVENKWRIWRFKWGEICFNGGFRFSCTYSAGDEVYTQNIFNFQVPLLNVFIYPPFQHITKNTAMEGPKWGFYTMEDSLWLCWGKNKKVLYYPWSWSFIRHSQLMKDGTWYTYGKKERSWEKSENVFKEIYPYSYKLRNGKFQHREATVYVDEREWRWLWLRKIPYPRLIRRTIDVKFNGEVGDRAGSWKGGTVGCGYDLKKHETPLQCLRRMEKERKFR